MKVIREVCVAGRTVDVIVKVTNRLATKENRRQPKQNVTPEDVQKNNDRYAAKTLMRKLNHNFKPGDYHCTLTYAGSEPTPEEAKKELIKFLRRLRAEYKKQGKELKRINVTEYRHTRIHHHIVLNQIEPEIISALWSKGHVKIAVLDEKGNYKKLADYLIKETTKTFRETESVNQRRYSCSRNVERPVVLREEVDERELWNDPKTLKGYYIEKDSIRRYEHPITQLQHLEYILISEYAKPRLKKWYRGIEVKPYANYRRLITQEQLEFLRA